MVQNQPSLSLSLFTSSLLLLHPFLLSGGVVVVSIIPRFFRDVEDNTLEIQIAPGPQLGEQVIEVESLSKGYGGDPIISDLTFTVPRGAVVGLIGPNGAGTTTLFKMIAGEEKPDSGTLKLGSKITFLKLENVRL